MELRHGVPGDVTAVQRIWREVGWIDEDEQAALLEPFVSEARWLVAELDGDAECSVTSHPGRLRYDGADLPLRIVSSVTTSRVARRLGLAGRLTARLLVDDADDGAVWSVLGMFDQGFYDRLGFGSGPTLLRYRFDPSTLLVDPPARQPVRLDKDDAAEIHEALVARRRLHGEVVVDAPTFTSVELAWTEKPFGLGFRDDSGELTHFVWGEATDEHGPYRVTALVHRGDEQLVELLGLLRTLGDQVRVVWLPEPPGLLVEDLLDQPSRHRFVTRGAEHPAEVYGGAWWQVRVLDVARAVAARRWHGHPVRFHLVLDDPLAAHDEVSWGGVHGDWDVELGEQSRATRGDGASLPTLTCGVGAFSRMLLGVAPATTLRLTSDLDGPADLLAALDDALRLPVPSPGMFF